MAIITPEIEQPQTDLVPPDRLPFIRGMDGLRAIAVMAVLFYHAEFGWALGGFLGVEMFLVISGYLITSLLLVEWLRTGTIDFKNFWLRRARRLLPAVALLLAVVTSISFLFYRDTLGKLGGEIVAAAGYFTNWLLIVRDVSYFESFERPSLLQHLWSLSVEEQFYVFWPVLFAVGMALFRFKNKQTSIRAFFALTVVGIVASTLLMAFLFTPFEDPSRVYYGTDTRVAGLLVGVALALVWIPWRLKMYSSRAARAGLNIFGFVALGALLILLVRVDEFAPLLYRGGFLVTSLATAGLIAVVVHPSGRLGAVLDNKVMNWIGTRSYGIYLWHWPVFMLSRPGYEVADAPVAIFILRTAATFLLAEASYRLVEMPIRRLGFRGWIGAIRAALGTSPIRAGVAGVLATAAVAVFAIGPQLADTSASASTPDIVSAAIESTPATTTTVATAPVTAPGSTSTASVSPASSSDASIATQSEPVTPGTSVEPEGDASDGAPTTVPAPETTSTTAADPSVSGNDPLIAASAPADDAAVQTPPSITIIGDSILAGSSAAVLETLADNQLTIDAAVSRQFKHAADVADQFTANGTLGDIVIIHLGTNGAFSDATFDEVMKSVASASRVVVLTTAVPRRWEEAVNSAIRSGVQRWPDVEILDWQAVAEAHDEWFNDDHVHLNPAGQRAYAELLAETVNR